MNSIYFTHKYLTISTLAQKNYININYLNYSNDKKPFFHRYNFAKDLALHKINP